jgi:hypothetical protein
MVIKLVLLNRIKAAHYFLLLYQFLSVAYQSCNFATRVRAVHEVT